MAITSRQYIKTPDLDPAVFAVNGSGQVTLQAGAGGDSTISINATTGVITHTSASGVITNITPKDAGALTYNGVTGDLTHTNSLGTPTTVTIPVATDSGSLTYNGVTGVLTHTNSDGTTQNVNLPLENFLNTAQYNATTNVLTLTLVDGTSFPVDLSDLQETHVLQVTDSFTVDLTLSGDGSTATPWDVTADVILDPAADNLLSSSAAGLKASPTQVAVTDTNSIDATLSGDGTAATPWNIQNDLIVDPAVNNVLGVSATGTLVDFCDVFDKLNTTFPTLDAGGLPSV